MPPLTTIAIALGIVGSVCAVLTFLWRIASVALKLHGTAIETNQSIVDLANKIGSKVPREGLLGDVQEMKEEIVKVKQEVKEEIVKVKDDVAEHGKSLAVIESGVAARRVSDKGR